MEVGDIIKCKDADECINTMTRLAREDIETDFIYEYEGKKVVYLIITKIKENKQ